MNVLIVDDELLAREEIARLLVHGKLPNCAELAGYKSISRCRASVVWKC